MVLTLVQEFPPQHNRWVSTPPCIRIRICINSPPRRHRLIVVLMMYAPLCSMQDKLRHRVPLTRAWGPLSRLHSPPRSVPRCNMKVSSIVCRPRTNRVDTHLLIPSWPAMNWPLRCGRPRWIATTRIKRLELPPKGSNQEIKEKICNAFNIITIQKIYYIWTILWAQWFIPWKWKEWKDWTKSTYKIIFVKNKKNILLEYSDNCYHFFLILVGTRENVREHKRWHETWSRIDKYSVVVLQRLDCEYILTVHAYYMCIKREWVCVSMWIRLD